MPFDIDVVDADWRAELSEEQLDALERRTRQCEPTPTSASAPAPAPARPKGRMTGADRARVERGSRE